MTKELYQKAKEILRNIDYVEKFRQLMFHNPFIKENNNSSDYMYLSWADNEQGDLKKTIVEWCDNEIAKLKKEFESL